MPVPAMPPGAAVGAKVPPLFTEMRSASDISRAGGALYSLSDLYQKFEIETSLGWFGGLESTRKIHTSRMGRVSFFLTMGNRLSEFLYFYFILGGTVRHQGSVWGQLGPTRIILEVFCLSGTLPEIPKW